MIEAGSMEGTYVQCSRIVRLDAWDECWCDPTFLLNEQDRGFAGQRVYWHREGSTIQDLVVG